MIKLTRTDGQKIGINSRRVLSVTLSTQSTFHHKKVPTLVHLNDSTDEIVQESVTEVIDRINKDRKKG